MHPKQTFLLSLSTALLITLLLNLGMFLYYNKTQTGMQSPTFNFTADSGTQKVLELQSAVQTVAKTVSPSVVSVIISEEVQTYRTDPFGFFSEPL